MNTTRFTLTVLLLGTMALSLAATSPPKATAESSVEQTKPGLKPVLLLSVETAIFERVNEVRGEHGLNPVKRDEMLVEIARDHSMEMLERGVFEDANPEGQRPVDKVSQRHRRLIGTIADNVWAGIRGDSVEEDGLANDIMEGLMNSSDHRAHILAEDMTHLGIGVSQAPGRKAFSTEVMATQLFASVQAYTKEPVPEEYRWGAVSNFILVSADEGASRKAEFFELWSPRDWGAGCRPDFPPAGADLRAGRNLPVTVLLQNTRRNTV